MESSSGTETSSFQRVSTDINSAVVGHSASTPATTMLAPVPVHAKMLEDESQGSVPQSDLSACSTSGERAGDDDDDLTKRHNELSAEQYAPSSNLPPNELLLVEENMDLKHLLKTIQAERDMLQEQLNEESSRILGKVVLAVHGFVERRKKPHADFLSLPFCLSHQHQRPQQ